MDRAVQADPYQYIASLPFDCNFLYGRAVGYPFVQLMKKAGRNPTRQEVINTLNGGGQLDAGPCIVSLGYSASSHLGDLMLLISCELGLPRRPAPARRGLASLEPGEYRV